MTMLPHQIPNIVAISAQVDGREVRRFRVDQWDLMQLWTHRVRQHGDMMFKVRKDEGPHLRLAWVSAQTMEEAIPDVHMRRKGADPNVVYGRLPNPAREPDNVVSRTG